VRAFLGLIDEFGLGAGDNDRAELCEAFRTGARYELAFATAAVSERFE
jgi:thiaminase